jgi:hypothetical protein
MLESGGKRDAVCRETPNTPSGRRCVVARSRGAFARLPNSMRSRFVSLHDRMPRNVRARRSVGEFGVMLKPERGGIDDAVAILGHKKRTVEAMALRGQLPGAAKLANRWTFDLELLRTYVRDEVKRQWAENARTRQQAASGVAILSMAGLGSSAVSSSGRYAQAIRRLRQSGGRLPKSA